MASTVIYVFFKARQVEMKRMGWSFKTWKKDALKVSKNGQKCTSLTQQKFGVIFHRTSNYTRGAKVVYRVGKLDTIHNVYKYKTDIWFGPCFDTISICLKIFELAAKVSGELLQDKILFHYSTEKIRSIPNLGLGLGWFL